MLLTYYVTFDEKIVQRGSLTARSFADLKQAVPAAFGGLTSLFPGAQIWVVADEHSAFTLGPMPSLDEVWEAVKRGRISAQLATYMPKRMNWELLPDYIKQASIEDGAAHATDLPSRGEGEEGAHAD